MLTSEDGRFLLPLGLLTCSLSPHGGRSRLCSADPSSMLHPRQLLQSSTPTPQHFPSPDTATGVLGKDFFQRYPTQA